MSKDYWYFAYGSNLWKSQKKKRTGPIRTCNVCPQIVRLADYRFAFNKRGDKGQIFANIMVASGSEVIGSDEKPSDEYLHYILTGANEHGLPIEYIEKIQKLALGPKG